MEEQHAVTVSPVAALKQAVAETGLTTEGALSLRNAFAPHFQEFHDLAAEASTITEDKPKAARALRLKLKAVRVASEKTRKALKEDSLRRGKAIDGINHLMTYQLVPVEKAMEDIEKAEERREAARKEALREERCAELEPFADPAFYDLGSMPEDQWLQLLAGAKAAHEAKVEAERKAEEERLAAEQAAAEALAKRQAEEAAERERLRTENEKAQAERDAAAKVAAEERAKREKLEAEVREREEAEAAQKEEAARKAAESAAAPDREKVSAYIAALRAIPALPATTEKGKALAAKLESQMAKFCAWLESERAKI